MSRGFVKESDQEELPPIPPRAALPPGVTNYVTPTGLAALKHERSELQAELDALPTDNEDEHRRSATVLRGKLALLDERLASARVLDPAEQPQEEVRFGAHVELRMGSAPKTQVFQLVGVDEANVKARKIAFTAPIARAITGLWAGEDTVLDLGSERRKVRVLRIWY